MSTIIDLTMPICDHFRWPVQREVRGNFSQGDLFQVTHITLTVHGFTHIDAPCHIIPGGQTTSNLDLTAVTGRATVVDLAAASGNSALLPNMAITPELLATAAAHVVPDDIVLLKSNWDTAVSYTTPEFWTTAPYLTRESAEWLLERKIKTIGYDFPQDYPIRLLLDGITAPIEEHVTHDVLLRNGVIMIEYLQNMGALTNPHMDLYALPLKIPDADGAPARVIAIEP